MSRSVYWSEIVNGTPRVICEAASPAESAELLLAYVRPVAPLHLDLRELSELIATAHGFAVIRARHTDDPRADAPEALTVGSRTFYAQAAS